MQVSFNPRRRRRHSRNRRRRSRNPLFAFNRRHRRHRRRSRNFGGAITSSVTSGFNVGALSKAGVVVGGWIANGYISAMLKRYLPMIPATGVLSWASDLATAGLMGYGARKVLPKYAGNLFFGGVLQVVMRVITESGLLGMLPSPGKIGELAGLEDYLSVSDAANARPLNGMDDYLTVDQARGPLFQLTGMENMGDATVAEELAAY